MLLDEATGNCTADSHHKCCSKHSVQRRSVAVGYILAKYWREVLNLVKLVLEARDEMVCFAVVSKSASQLFAL